MRRPLDMIPILDSWIDAAEEIVACRWLAVSRQATDTFAIDPPHPLADLLSILHLMRQYRDQRLQEAGYAGFGYLPPARFDTPIEHQQG